MTAGAKNCMINIIQSNIFWSCRLSSSRLTLIANAENMTKNNCHCAASLKVSMECSMKGFLAAYTLIAAKHINIAMMI